MQMECGRLLKVSSKAAESSLPHSLAQIRSVYAAALSVRRQAHQVDSSCMQYRQAFIMRSPRGYRDRPHPYHAHDCRGHDPSSASSSTSHRHGRARLSAAHRATRVLSGSLSSACRKSSAHLGRSTQRLNSPDAATRRRIPCR